MIAHNRAGKGDPVQSQKHKILQKLTSDYAHRCAVNETADLDVQNKDTDKYRPLGYPQVFPKDDGAQSEVHRIRHVY